jgi:hypothetical protein
MKYFLIQMRSFILIKNDRKAQPELLDGYNIGKYTTVVIKSGCDDGKTASCRVQEETEHGVALYGEIYMPESKSTA